MARITVEDCIDKLALREIAESDPGRVVEVDEGTFVSLPIYCQMQLASMPPEGLAAYRRRVDAAAEAAYRAGVASRDADELARVVDESFCNSWGDDALAALGELALERGDYAAARRAWHAISPELRDRIEVACFERGLIILSAGASAIRWSPPLILTKENVDVALEIFDEAITASV